MSQKLEKYIMKRYGNRTLLTRAETAHELGTNEVEVLVLIRSGELKSQMIFDVAEYLDGMGSSTIDNLTEYLGESEIEYLYNLKE